ncbi:hypothetical protein BaRGS_00023133 [Batillaria attramentaria]|uniref:F-box only protein 9 n=1 Tax=Batillaria attramentaria TaxID=370345 RepID=A0ABD0KEZ6_9CAEN
MQDASQNLLSAEGLESEALEDEEEGEDVPNLQDELQEFRQRWQQELQSSDASGSESHHQQAGHSIEEEAKELFLQGMQAEQNGALYEAIRYYRRAMQLVPDIESKIDFFQHRSPRERQDSESSTDGSGIEEVNEDLIQRFQSMKVQENSICEAAFEQRAVHISSMPVEVLMYIFRWVVSSELDLRSLEMLSQVCRGFYLCARDEGLWKTVCLRIWGSHCGSCKKFGGWRKMYLERPHLMFNGCYISRATYVRQGEQGMDNFYRPFHMVAYYRYIRFFPDGSMLMMCSPEEPTLVIPKLRSLSSRAQGLMKGYFKMSGTKVMCVLKRVNTSKQEPVLRYKRQKQAANQNEMVQTYSVEFELTDSGQQRYNRLNWVSYAIRTVYKATGDETVADFELKNSAYPPLVFSRVRSYTIISAAPLE